MFPEPDAGSAAWKQNAMTQAEDYYSVLGVPFSADEGEIKTAFRRLALLHHPDRTGNSPDSQARFILILHAYKTLLGAQTRKEYDAVRKRSGKDRTSSSARKDDGHGTGFPGNSREYTLAQLNDILWGVEDILGDILAPGRRLPCDPGMILDQLLGILSFIDAWVLEPAGFTDYFYSARRMEKSAAFPGKKGQHVPYVNCRDYFYEIRKRMNRFIERTTESDLMAPLCGSIRRIDAVIEGFRLARHHLGGIALLMAGEKSTLGPFVHSDPVFDRPGPASNP